MMADETMVETMETQQENQKSSAQILDEIFRELKERSENGKLLPNSDLSIVLGSTIVTEKDAIPKKKKDKKKKSKHKHSHKHKRQKTHKGKDHDLEQERSASKSPSEEWVPADGSKLCDSDATVIVEKSNDETVSQLEAVPKSDCSSETQNSDHNVVIESKLDSGTISEQSDDVKTSVTDDINKVVDNTSTTHLSPEHFKSADNRKSKRVRIEGSPHSTTMEVSPKRLKVTIYQDRSENGELLPNSDHSVMLESTIVAEKDTDSKKKKDKKEKSKHKHSHKHKRRKKLKEKEHDLEQKRSGSRNSNEEWVPADSVKFCDDATIIVEKLNDETVSQQRSPSKKHSHRARRSGSRDSTKRSYSPYDSSRSTKSRKSHHHSSSSRQKSRRSHSPKCLSRRSRSHSRNFSDSEDRHKSSSKNYEEKIDKVKLLEIARKNALIMIAEGKLSVPVVLDKPQQERIALKPSEKSVEELTNFCKLLSKKEKEEEEKKGDKVNQFQHSSDDEDDKGAPFVHHPFKLRDHQPSIIMNIKNAVQLPIKTPAEKVADSAKLRIQFPVSSGTQHRKQEWVPVSPKKDKPVEVKKEEQVTTVATISPPSTSNVVFSQQPVVPAVDIGSIVSQRLKAVRKLMENPHDMEALNQMYKSQQQMQNWAQSKQLPGQFTGSTDAHILTPEELAGPAHLQAWVRKDQFNRAAPVQGGFGMYMLQKMGWKPGEGLGKNKEGTAEPIILDIKTDKKGLVSQGEITRKTAAPVVKDLSGKHPVSALVELCNKRRWVPPEFVLIHDSGPDHKKNFVFKVLVNGEEFQPAIASPNKKHAKAQAATVCLQTLGLVPR